MTGRKKRLIIFILLAAVLAGTGTWIYFYFVADERKIEKLIWELRGCPETKFESLLAKVGIKTQRPKPRDQYLVLNDLSDFGRLAIPYVIDLLKHDPDQSVRNIASDYLYHVNDPIIVGIFTESIYDKDDFVKLSALSCLCSIGDHKAVPPIIDLMNKDPSNISIYIESLSKFDDPRIVEPLISEIESGDKDYFPVVIMALNELKNPRAVEPLIKILESDEKKVYAHAANALGRIGDKRAVMPIVRILREWYKKQAAGEPDYIKPMIVALGRLGDERGVEVLVDLFPYEKNAIKKALNQIVERQDFISHVMLTTQCLLRNNFADQKDFANYLSDIGIIGDREEPVEIPAAISLHELVEKLYEDKDPRLFWFLFEILYKYELNNDYIKQMASEYLGLLGDRRAIGALRDYLVNAYSGKSLEISFNALMVLGDKNVGDYVFTRYLNSNSDNAFATLALGKLKYIRAFDNLAAEVADKNNNKIEPAAEALGMIGGEKAKNILLNVLLESRTSQNVERGLAAVKGLSQLHDPQLISYFVDTVKLLESCYSSSKSSLGTYIMRLAAIGAIGKIGGSKAIEALGKLLQHWRIDVRQAAARELCKLADPAAESLLKAASEDLHWQVRAWGQAGLYRLGDAKAIGPVIELFNSRGDRKVEEALNIFCELKDKHLVSELAKRYLEYDEEDNKLRMFSSVPPEFREKIIECLVYTGGKEALEALQSFIGKFPADYEIRKAYYKVKHKMMAERN